MRAHDAMCFALALREGEKYRERERERERERLMDVSEVQLVFSHMVNDVIANYLAIRESYHPEANETYRDVRIAESIAAMSQSYGLHKGYGRDAFERLLANARDPRIIRILMMSWDA